MNSIQRQVANQQINAVQEAAEQLAVVTPHRAESIAEQVAAQKAALQELIAKAQRALELLA